MEFMELASLVAVCPELWNSWSLQDWLQFAQPIQSVQGNELVNQK